MKRELANLAIELTPTPSTPRHDPKLSQRTLSLFHSDDPCNLSVPGGRRLEFLHRDPNILFVEHFLSPRELLQFDELISAHRNAFKLSHTDSSSTGEVLQSEERTSESLVLPKASTALLRAVEARAAELVGLPADHTEPVQVVRYSNGASFHMHHDLAEIEEGRASATSRRAASGCTEAAASRDVSEVDGCPSYESYKGVMVDEPNGARRIVTVFVYLNTLPTGIGHTEFPLLSSSGKPRGVSCRPRSGSAIVFCNVDAQGRPDARLCHQACPVPPGDWKYGLNLWVTDVTQQAHAVDAAPCKRAPFTSRSKSLLSPLLFVEPTDLPPPPFAALKGMQLQRAHKRKGGTAKAPAAKGPAMIDGGTVESVHPLKGYRLVRDDGSAGYVSPVELLTMVPTDGCDLIRRRVKRIVPGVGGGFVDGSVVATVEEGLVEVLEEE